MLRLLLTGSNGFIGRRVAQALSQNGYEVVGVDPVSHPAYTPPHETVQDIAESDLLRWRPDKIILCGAMKGLAACGMGREPFERNISGLMPYLRYGFLFPTTQVLFVSSDMVFGGMADGAPFPENSPVSPCNAYGAMKVAGEQMVSLLPNHTIVRTALVYGELDNEEYVRFADDLAKEELENQTLFYSWLATQIRDRRRVRLADNVYSSPTWVMDLVRDILFVLELNLTGIFHSCGSGRYSRMMMGERVLAPLGLSGCIERFSVSAGLRPLDVSLNSELTRRRLSGLHVLPEDVMSSVVRRMLGE